MPNFNRTAFICLAVFMQLLWGTEPVWTQDNVGRFHALAYHGVVDSRDQLASDDVTLETLINHFEWLVAENFTPISIDQLIEARNGTYQLPEKPVLLCWDDGYESFYTHVLPLLKAYGFPAVLALVGEWMTTPEGDLVKYGDGLVPREKFLSWEQVRAVEQSSLVEIASHSFGLHRGLLADRAGDQIPAAITHVYSPQTNTYETDDQKFARILEDLIKNNALIYKNTGISPRVMVWPFGRYNALAVEAAKEAGMDITLTLDPVSAHVNDLATIARIYPTLNPEAGSFKYSFIDPPRPPLRRFIMVQTSDLIEEDEDSEHSFGTFLERVKSLAPGRVYFKPFIVEDGEPKALFQNNQIPVLQDRLTRLVWHTNRRAEAEVHLIIDGSLLRQLGPHDYIQFWGDMGKFGPGSGLLLTDDLFVEELLELINTISSDPFEPPAWHPNQTRKQRKRFAEKTDRVIVTNHLQALESFQYWQPFLDVGVLVPFDLFQNANPANLTRVLRMFDYIMVDLRQVEDPVAASKKIVELERKIKRGPFITSLISFEKGDDESYLASQLTDMLGHGIVDFGYAYDFFIDKKPTLETMKPLISTREYPFIPK